ncbi:MAG: hypothetical protein AAGA96_19365, partial [Verrucomicrobiota bacterium]
RGQPMTGFDYGVWIWGALLVAVIFSCLWIIICAAPRVILPTKKDDPVFFEKETSRWISGLYLIVRELATLIGALVAFGGLAWAHFFTIDRRRDEPRDPVQIFISMDEESKRQLYSVLKAELDPTSKERAENSKIGVDPPPTSPESTTEGDSKIQPDPEGHSQ